MKICVCGNEHPNEEYATKIFYCLKDAIKINNPDLRFYQFSSDEYYKSLEELLFLFSTDAGRMVLKTRKEQLGDCKDLHAERLLPIDLTSNEIIKILEELLEANCRCYNRLFPEIENFLLILDGREVQGKYDLILNLHNTEATLLPNKLAMIPSRFKKTKIEDVFSYHNYDITYVSDGNECTIEIPAAVTIMNNRYTILGTMLSLFDKKEYVTLHYDPQLPENEKNLNGYIKDLSVIISELNEIEKGHIK